MHKSVNDVKPILEKFKAGSGSPDSVFKISELGAVFNCPISYIGNFVQGVKNGFG